MNNYLDNLYYWWKNIDKFLLFLILALFLLGLNNSGIESNSVIAKKYSKQWFVQLFFLFLVLIIFFNFLFF